MEQPPPPPLPSNSSTQSPRSPPRKRRSGTFCARAVASTGPAPVIPTHYERPFFAPSFATESLAALFAHQCSLERQHALTNAVSLILDTGATISVTNCTADFVTPIRPVQHTTLQGIAAGLSIKGLGTVKYSVSDDSGTLQDLVIPDVLYVPDCPSRLLCPRQLLASTRDPTATMQVNGNGIVISFRNSRITVPYHKRTLLPVLMTIPSIACYYTSCQLSQQSQGQCDAASSRDSKPKHTSEICPPLTPSQRTKLLWHRRLNHVSFDQLNAWMRAGLIPVSQGVINAPSPVCAVCQYGKAQRRTHLSSTGVIGATHDHPGAGVSADQLEAGCPGLLPTTKGSPTSQRYYYCNVWVDHYSRLVYVTMHSTKEAKEMLASKLEYEAFCRRHGVTVKSVRADNGVYASQLFRAHCDTHSQKLSFCAVGGHWQNGIAERCIGIIQTVARTILLQAMSLWPTTINESYWPFAIRHAVNLYNHTTRLGCTASPWELFTGEPSNRKLIDWHVFGSPVYVLHKSLQDSSGSRQKWKSRCWQGVYLGQSPAHASNVALVYNPETTHVSPQFHVTFDDTFSSVSSTDPDASAACIESLLQKTAWMYSDEYGPPSALHYFTTESEHLGTGPTLPLSTHQEVEDPPKSFQAYKPVKASQVFERWKQQNGIQADIYAPVPEPPSPPGTLATVPSSHAPSVPPSTTVCEGATSTHAFLSNSRASHGTHQGPMPESLEPVAISIALPDDVSNDLLLRPCEGAYPYYAYPATPTSGDTLTQSAMLKAPDHPAFVTAQVPEIQGLHDTGVFSYHRVETLPPQARLLNAIWSYRRKRSPAGLLLKHKARVCTDGSQQQYGVDYWETYAPVVSWSTVRLLLSLASTHSWHSSQIDFAQAFTQPPIAEDIYMKIPQGWYVENNTLQQHSNPKYRDVEHYIKLEKSLYGIKQAARAWFHFLEPGLLKLGFKASEVDPCLFYRDDCIVVLYVDDCLLFSPQQGVIDDVITALRHDYQIGAQGSIQDFLGIHIHKDSDGAIHFTQPGLIQSILQDLQLTDCHRKFTPAISVLHPDHGGHARCEQWNYRSVLGKLNFLAQMTRPDISMAVHNCARFTTAPTYLHEQAVKRIGRYLSTTSDKGLIYRPTQTGYVILYSGCPIHWGSKLQTEIALSTTESEYIALSTAARELIPIRRLLRALSLYSPLRDLTPHPPGQLPPSTIFEDNASCIAIANKDNHHKPRTKHISLKYHHFKDYIRSGALQVIKIASASNLADIFTKPLCQVLHERLRYSMMGW